MTIADEPIIGGGPATATLDRARAYLLAAPGRLLTVAEVGAIVDACYWLAGPLGIRWDLALAQTCHETRRYLFGGQVALTQHNPAGIGATNDGSPGLSYPDWRTGLAAYFVHLLAWCDRLDLATRVAPDFARLDPRLALVAEARRGRGPATTWRSLGGRWAVPGHGYGDAVARHHAAILAMAVEEGDMAIPEPTIDRSHPSPNRGYANGFAHRPEALVWHVTAGGFAGSLSWLTNPASQASANYLIDKDGAILELVPPTESAWANGAVNRPDAGNPSIARWLAEGANVNQRTVSIEVVREQSANGRPGGFTPSQHASLVALSAWLCARFGIPADRGHILRHAQIDSVDRANCPGLAETELAAWIGEIAALVAPAPAGVVTERIDWGGAGEVVASAEYVVVRNPATGRVYCRRRTDGTLGEWVELTREG